MEKITSTKDIKALKLISIGILIVLLFNTCYNTIYTNVARRSCFTTARAAMGATGSSHVIIAGDDGATNAAAYNTYFSMCMSDRYGLSE